MFSFTYPGNTSQIRVHDNATFCIGKDSKTTAFAYSKKPDSLSWKFSMVENKIITWRKYVEKESDASMKKVTTKQATVTVPANVPDSQKPTYADMAKRAAAAGSEVPQQ